MRGLSFACAVACAIAPVTAHAAPTAAELRAAGEQDAKEGRYTEAIDAFKAANRLQPRATNYCLIGLAYTRRELWPQAEIMIDRCKELASAGDPLPDWMPALERVLAERLAAVEVAPVEIVVEPATAQAELTVASFAPDEQFRARTIHLPPGTHLVVATAPGYRRGQASVVVTDRHPQRIVITLQPEQTAPPPPPRTGDTPTGGTPTGGTPAGAPPAPPPPPGGASTLSTVVLAAGAGLVAAGAVYHATAFRTAAGKLADATDATPDPAQYDAWSHRFDVRRDWVIGLYAAGAVTLGVGVILRLTSHVAAEQAVQVGVRPTRGGGVVTVGWSR